MAGGDPTGWRPALSRQLSADRGDLALVRRQLDDECQRLLERVRKHCPELLPDQPVPAGTLADEVHVPADVAVSLVRSGLAIAAGVAPAPRPASVLWRKGDLHLLVHVADAHMHLDVGNITVIVPVTCDEVGTAEVTVPFAVGSERRPAGLVAATEERPRGPAPVVALWSDELLALAWRGLLEGIAAIAGASGRDEDGATLVPAALSADAKGITVQAMARHRPQPETPT